MILGGFGSWVSLALLNRRQRRRKTKGLRLFLELTTQDVACPSQVAYCEPGLATEVMPLPSVSRRREPKIWGMRGGGLTVGWVVYSYYAVDIKTLDNSLLI